MCFEGEVVEEANPINGVFGGDVSVPCLYKSFEVPVYVALILRIMNQLIYEKEPLKNITHSCLSIVHSIVSFASQIFIPKKMKSGFVSIRLSIVWSCHWHTSSS